MNLDALTKKLMQAARLNPPKSDVPYHFEQRIMARLRQHRPTLDPWLVWSRGLWRASLPCLALLGLVAIWNWQQPTFNSTEASLISSSEELEVAAVDAVDFSDSQEDAW